MADAVNLIEFSTGRGAVNRGRIRNETAPTFEAFCLRILALGRAYPPAPAAATASERQTHKERAPFFARAFYGDRRVRSNVKAARFLVADIDYCPKTAKPQIETTCGTLSALAYETARSTEQAPRLRIVVETTRDILPEETAAAANAFAEFLYDHAPDLPRTAPNGEGAIDVCSEKPEQYMYCPHADAAAKAQIFHGAPFDVDAAMRKKGEAPAAKPKAEKKKAKPAAETREAVATATADELTPSPLPADFRDPALKALDEKGLILGAGKVRGEWRILCPFEDEHTEKRGSDDDDTVYREAGTGGKRYGQFICQHSHCFKRPQADFFKAVGVDNARYKTQIDALNGTPERFRAAGGLFTNDGARVFFAKQIDAEGFARAAPLFDLIEVKALTRDAGGDNWGRLVRYCDRDGLPRETIIRDADLAGDAATVRKTFAAAGLRFYTSAKNTADLLSAYLTFCPCYERARTVAATGWYKPHGQNAAVYVLPSETIGALDGEAVRYLADRKAASNWSVKGTADGWRKTVGAFLPFSRPLTLAVGAALAAPLARLIGAADMTGGFHFYGASQSGKTTALEVAAGIYGEPKHGDGSRVSGWHGTTNSLETQAVANTDGLLCLDEISTHGANVRNKGQALSGTIYRLSEGIERGRLDKNAEQKALRTWFCLILSSGEGASRHYVERGGAVADVGLATRLIDIPAAGRGGVKIFDLADAGADAVELFSRLYAGLSSHYGAVGRGWLEYLTASQGTIREAADGWAKAFDKAAAKYGAPSGGQLTRARMRFELCAVAYGLACAAGILSNDAAAGVDAVAYLYAQWAEEYGTGDQEETRMIERFRAACDQPKNFPPFTRYADGLAAPDVGRDVMGFRETLNAEADEFAGLAAPEEPKADEEDESAGAVFWILREPFEKLAGGVGVKSAVKALKARGILLAGSDRAARKQRKVRGILTAFYRLDADALYRNEETNEEE